MKTAEEILIEFGCPDVTFDENVTMYYPAILSAMEEYANARVGEAMITEELTIELQKEILDKMFGFALVDESDGGEPHYVVYDEDGNEFYGSNENCKYDLSTFGGIIRYAEDRGYKMGYLSCQMDMRKVLGIS